MRARARTSLYTHKYFSECKVFDGKEDETMEKSLGLIRADLDHWGEPSP